MADASVVVMKFQPMNAGNSREDKTETMMSGGLIKLSLSKAVAGCEGAK